MALKGKVALITGSTSGIGWAIARALAEAGADVMLNGFGEPALIERLCSELGGLGVRVLHDPADMTRPDQIAAMVARTTEALGGPDILVNNAGIQHVAPIEAFPPERWEAVIGINLSAVFYGMRAAIPPMRARGWGRIISIASTHGLVASAEKAAYVAAKHGVVGLTKVAAIELAGAAITANAICPGWVLTPLVERQVAARAEREGTSFDEAKHRLVAEKQPMARFTTPEQIGALAVFLCSDAAATITGASLPIDGGWVAQ